MTLARIAANPWSGDQVVFQAWLALPSSARSPRTQQGLARQLGVAEQTLCDWKRIPGFLDAAYALALENVKADLAAVLAAQVREAKKGSLPHAQWLFQLADKWHPRVQHDHAGEGGGPLRIVIETVDDRALPDASRPQP